MAFKPRKSQAEVLSYTGGYMGISAVPGAGKTHTLSALAADLTEKLVRHPDYYDPDSIRPEVLVVTFSNAAAANFSARIGKFLEDRHLIPGIGYHVSTLHSLALEIIRGHTQELGIDEDFTIIDEAAANRCLEKAVDIWLERNGQEVYRHYTRLKPGTQPFEERFQDPQRGWKSDIVNISRNVISQAKDYHMTPELLQHAVLNMQDIENIDLLQMICDIYGAYQTQLRLQAALDFGDLMFYAYRLLSADPNYLTYLQNRWPYVLEDEAQDSSMIQEQVLRLLTSRSGNWVRVGDTNQAINETFTTADPRFLKNFLVEAEQKGKKVDLKEAGRSSRSILVQANHLIRWVNVMHPNPDCRDALSVPYVRLTDPGDVQGNPPDAPERIIFDKTAYNSADEVTAICRLAAEHAKNHREETIVILVPNNKHGYTFVDRLADFPVEVVEMLRSSRSSRTTADVLAEIIGWVSQPLDKKKTAALFEMLYNPKEEDEFYLDETDSAECLRIMDSFAQPEDFFYPLDEAAFAEKMNELCTDEVLAQTLMRFRYFLKRWLEARFLPIEQFVLYVGQDLFTAPDDLCTAGQLGAILQQTLRINPNMGLFALAAEAKRAAANASLYLGVRGAESQFNPELYRGKIVVSTFHKAKGLEWDQVYLTSCNSFDFPLGYISGTDGMRASPGYIRNQLDLQAECLELLRIAALPEERREYVEGAGSYRAFVNGASERLRLLYVGITRAKRGLYVSWNTGDYNNLQETPSVRALRLEWTKKQSAA